MKQNRNKKNRMKLSLILLPFIGAGVITPLAAFAINSVVNGSRQATNGGDLNIDIGTPSGILPNATFGEKPDSQAVIFAIYANNSSLKVNAVKATGGTQVSGSPEKWSFRIESNSDPYYGDTFKNVEITTKGEKPNIASFFGQLAGGSYDLTYDNTVTDSKKPGYLKDPYFPELGDDMTVKDVVGSLNTIVNTTYSETTLNLNQLVPYKPDSTNVYNWSDIPTWVSNDDCYVIVLKPKLGSTFYDVSPGDTLKLKFNHQRSKLTYNFTPDTENIFSPIASDFNLNPSPTDASDIVPHILVQQRTPSETNATLKSKLLFSSASSSAQLGTIGVEANSGNFTTNGTSPTNAPISSKINLSINGNQYWTTKNQTPPTATDKIRNDQPVEITCNTNRVSFAANFPSWSNTTSFLQAPSKDDILDELSSQNSKYIDRDSVGVIFNGTTQARVYITGNGTSPSMTYAFSDTNGDYFVTAPQWGQLSDSNSKLLEFVRS